MKQKLFVLMTSLILLIELVSAQIADGDFYHHEGMYGMMAGSYGYGWMILGWAMGLLVVVVLILLIIWLVKQLQKK